MAGIIEIRNLRNIAKLRFEIPDRGVWLLTAPNGSGKTSLLGCLHRIGYSNAFGVHFPSSLKSNRIDNHSKGKINYEINGRSVEYAYRGARWTPRPRRNSHLLEKFGYSSVIYIGVTVDRISPRPEDFDPRNVKTAGSFIVDAANFIFDTNKFSMLRTINLAPGVGNDVFVLALGGTPLTYHSEKQFSLGELCILKLLRLLKDANNNSMIIIDELEMALHPRAQVNLLRYLEKQAQDKSLTIIFSTHSTALLKSIDRRKILYLDKQDNGEIISVIGCFPTYAIGNIASDEESLPDIVLYVEDLFARDIMTAFFEKFAIEKFSDPTARPSLKIVPIGPYDAVISFLERNHSVLPNQVTQKAILDEDVASESIAALKRSNNHAKLEKIQKLKKDIRFFPFTPEVGLMDYIASNQQAFEQALRQRCVDHQLRIGSIVDGYNTTLSGPDKRKAAKKSAEALEAYLCQRTQRSEETVREQICGVFANLAWEKYRSSFMDILGSVIH